MNLKTSLFCLLVLCFCHVSLRAEILRAYADTYIRQTSPDKDYADDTNLWLSGMEPQYQGGYAILKFDLSQIHQERRIASATLRVFRSSGTAVGNVIVGVCKVLQPWTQRVTWNEFGAGPEQGIHYDANYLDTQEWNEAGDQTWSEFTIASDVVQSWLDNPLNNNGLIFVSQPEGSSVWRAFASHENLSTPPELVVNYESFCGDSNTSYHSADLNKDCYVNLNDFSIIAENWIKCTTLGDLTCDSSDLGFVVFSRNYMDRCDSDTEPTPQERARKLRKLKVFATPGEYEPISFSIRADKRLSQLSVSMTSDLQMADKTISADNVTILEIAPLKETFFDADLEYLLMDKSASDLLQNKTRRYWVTVEVPQTAVSGIYTSKIIVKQGNTQIDSIDYELEVLPFVLDGLTDITYFNYYPQWGWPAWSLTSAYNQKCLLDQKKHGMNLYSAYVDVSPGTEDPIWTGREWRFPIGQTLVDINETGFLAPGGKYLWMGAKWRAAGMSGDEGVAVAQAFVDAVQNAGYEMIFYGIDEPVDEQSFQATRTLIPVMRENFPGIKIATSLGSEGIEAIGEYYDIWICAGWTLTDEIITKAQNEDKTLWTYECGLAPNDAHTLRYYYGYMLWQTGIKGAAFWNYFDMQIDDWVTPFDWEAGWSGKNINYHDIVWFDPDNGPIDSVISEAGREGIDDFKYLRTLENVIQQLTTAGKADKCTEALEYISDINDLIEFENYGTAYTDAKSLGTENGYQYQPLFYRKTPDPRLRKDDYNNIRRKVADFIIQLNGELNG